MARWGHSNEDYLFSTYDFHAVQETQRERLKKTINEAPAADIRDGTVEEVAVRFVQQFELHAPELTEGAISATVDETPVDISRDRSLSFQYGTFGAGPHHVPGITATYFVPYVGEREIFRCRPNRYTSMIPAAEVTGNDLRFRFVEVGENVAATKVAFDRELQQVKEYLSWLDENARTFNSSILPLARDLVTRRRDRLSNLDQGTQSLGIPIRRADSPATRSSTGSSAPKMTATRPPERYDVALSFAGENRAFVEEVANALKAAGVSLFYDGFEKADLWGKNLIDHLAEIYQQRSRYVVMFISEHYVRKAWPQHERQHAQARALLAKEEYILPARFDDTDVPGMTNTVGHIDLRTTSASELVALILAKVGRTRR